MSLYFMAMFKPLNHLILNILMEHVTCVKPTKYGTLLYKIMIKVTIIMNSKHSKQLKKNWM
jgi:hypothetical protein